MISETFPSHYNPQPSTETPPTPVQAEPEPPIQLEPVKPTPTVQSTPAPANPRKAINFSSASA